MRENDNKKLAEFITRLGKFNDYGSTVSQTLKALETSSTESLRQDNDDVIIFEDTLKGIRAVKEQEFSVESIIAINAQFTGDSDEQPQNPGLLRDGLLRPHTDKTMIKLWPLVNGSLLAYYPPLQVDEWNLKNIVEEWEDSSKTIKDGWLIFAKLAKLQPFQDGNKRTALIAANLAIGALETQDYLMPPSGRKFHPFMNALLGYYGVGLEDGPVSDEVALEEFLAVLGLV